MGDNSKIDREKTIVLAKQIGDLVAGFPAIEVVTAITVALLDGLRELPLDVASDLWNGHVMAAAAVFRDRWKRVGGQMPDLAAQGFWTWERGDA